MSKTVNGYESWFVSLRFEIVAKRDRAMHLPIVRRISCSTTVRDVELQQGFSGGSKSLHPFESFDSCYLILDHLMPVIRT